MTPLTTWRAAHGWQRSHLTITTETSVRTVCNLPVRGPLLDLDVPRCAHCSRITQRPQEAP